MRAGNLDRQITIQTLSTTIDLYGTPVKTWTTFATMRAQLLQFDTSNREGVRSATDTTITFRIYWIAALSLEHRVLYDGQAFKIQKIKQIGRRAGLDIVCERVGS